VCFFRTTFVKIPPLYLSYYFTYDTLAFAFIVTIAFSPLYDSCLVILILAGLTPNNRFLSSSRLLSCRLFHTSLSIYLPTAADGCHCSTLRERFPEISSTYYTHHLRHPLPSPLTVSFSAAHRGMPTFHSTIFLSRTRTKRRQEVAVEVDGSALRPPRTPTRARIQAVSGG